MDPWLLSNQGSDRFLISLWLFASGRATTPYVAGQGTVLGRASRVHVTRSGRRCRPRRRGHSTRMTGEIDL